MDADVSPLLQLLAKVEAVDDSGELFSEELGAPLSVFTRITTPKLTAG